MITSPAVLLQEIVRALSSELVLPGPIGGVRLVYRKKVVDQVTAAQAIANGYTVSVIATDDAGGVLALLEVSARWGR